jgi:hypothetical protein
MLVYESSRPYAKNRPFQNEGIPSFLTMADTVVPIPAPLTCIRVLTVSCHRIDDGDKERRRDEEVEHKG